MSNSNLASLPPSMLHKNLSKVATNHIRDFGSARVALPAFNQIGREEYFYKSADLIHFSDWIDEVNAVRTYMLKCYQAGNPQAIYMQGMYEVFVLHLLDQGREKFVLLVRGDFCWPIWDFYNDIHLTVSHWPIED
ncbi:unnamed protein product [Eruca vesicaria subsp. sativa]|uniref:Uncharacterized protein n=1 Tax=Eruca vesicaria subsp. sativa TaxID=29727 RepID=A0ABC8JQH3_ERUVS|nr:unnamed protein product [Eruca vesicaria subsp. sativa]